MAHRSPSPLATRPRAAPASDAIELDTSPPSRSGSPLPRQVSLERPLRARDYGATSSAGSSLDLGLKGSSSDALHDDAAPDGLEDDLATPEAPRDERWERAFALFVAVMLSIGSHFGSYLLGPLKSRLHRESPEMSNSSFSLLLAAMSLNNTWTPLVGGLLTAKIGAPRASVLATSVVFLGQLLVLLSTGDGEDGSKNNIKGMAAGLFVFGLGVSPLAVVQETIIVRYFSTRGLGLSLAFGLVAGKGASFVSSIVSYPLSDRYGTRGPFIVSTSLAGLSFFVNILYLIFHARLHPKASDSRKSDEAAAERVIQRRKVKLFGLARLGGLFWGYIACNVASGAIWSPFLHLSSNIIQRRFQLPDATAASYASLLLAGAIFLYPLAGAIHDLSHRRHSSSSSAQQISTIVYKLLALASCLTLFCFAWLVFPAEWTRTPVPALLSFGIGHGFATLLLVLVVPGIVRPEWVSTALGTHKSMEAAATTLTQTLSGLLLDKASKTKPPATLASGSGAPPSSVDLLKPHAGQDAPPPPSTTGTWILLVAFLLINIFQLATIVGIWRAFARRCALVRAAEEYAALPKDDDASQEEEEDDVAQGATHDDEDAAQDEHELRHHAARTLSASSHRPLLWSESASISSTVPSMDVTPVAFVDPRECTEAVERRGRWFMGASAAFVLLTWGTFGAVSLAKG